MGCDCSREFFFELAQVSGLPQIANFGVQMARVAKIFPRETNFLFGGGAIEQDHGTASILHLPGPDFKITVFHYAAALTSEGILIHRDHFLVGKDVVDLWLHVA